MTKILWLYVFTFFVINSAYSAPVNHYSYASYDTEINAITRFVGYKWISSDEIEAYPAIWKVHPDDLDLLHNNWRYGGFELWWASNKEYPFNLIQDGSKKVSARVAPLYLMDIRYDFLELSSVNPFLGTVVFTDRTTFYPDIVQVTWTVSLGSAPKLLVWMPWDTVIFAKTGNEKYPVMLYDVNNGLHVKAKLTLMEGSKT